MRSGILTLLAACALPIGASAQRYKVEVVTTQNVDLSPMGQPSQSVRMASTGYVTLTMSDTTGGRLAHIVIDSSTFEGGEMMAQVDPAMLGDAAGAVFHLYVVDGRIAETVPPAEMNLRVITLMPAVTLLFPAPKATAHAGDTWTDTTRVDSTTVQGRVTGTNVINWSVTSVDGPIYVLVGKTVGTTSIDMALGQLVGTTTGTQQITSTALGPAISVTNDLLTDMSMAVGEGSVPINVKGTSKMTVTRLQ